MAGSIVRSVAATLLASVFVSAAATSAEYEVEVASDKDVYQVGETAAFTGAVYKNSRLLNGHSAEVAATYPDGDTPVDLNEVYRGSYAFDAMLDEAGEMTLTISVLQQRGIASLILGWIVDQLEDRLADLEEMLANESDPCEQRMIQRKISLQARVISRLQRIIDRMVTPVAVGSKTIVVEEPLPSDTTPPVFGFYWPTPPNGYTWINDAYGSIGAEVSDDESGVASVILIVSGESKPIKMDYDGAVAQYVPDNAWAEGLHTVTLVATDNAGNSSSFDYGFYVDLTPPVVASFSPRNTTDSTPLIIISVKDKLSGVYQPGVFISIDGSASVVPVVDGNIITYMVQQPLSLGDHYVTVQVSDCAGNHTIAYFTMTIVG